MNKPVLTLHNIKVSNLQQTILNNLSFKIDQGEQWALVGESGSGKSALLHTLAGKFNINSGSARYHFFEHFVQRYPAGQGYLTYHKLTAFVSSKHGFRNLSNTTDFYYQQRFNASDSEDSPTVNKYIDSIKPAEHSLQLWNKAQIIERLELWPLLDKQLIKLSNGETKRLMIAAALLKKPSLLLLDNPLTGLDVQSRADFNVILHEIAVSGITVVLATSPYEIPDSVTHVAIMQRGQIISSMPKSQFNPAMVAIGEANEVNLGELSQLLSIKTTAAFEDLVCMRDVTIRYGDQVILRNVNWQIKPGDRWALLGPNGAGKSTLLSLINGDNPQAYANDILLFDRKRGTGESIWDIKSKIGFVSPELHQYFPTDNNCLQVIESGFYDTLGLFRPSQPQKAQLALRWIKLLKVEQFTGKPFKNISASGQRLVLLARALVKNPPLLIFDEPCQGLDAYQQQHFKSIVDAICWAGNTALIYVTHYQHEIPESVDQVLRLDKGMVVG